MSISVHNPGRRISESIWNVNTINLGECEKIVIYISPIFTIWPTQYWQKVIIWAPVRIVVSYSNAPLQTAHCSFCLSNFIIGPSRTTARLSQKASAYINNTNSVHTDPRFPSLLPTFLIRSCLNDGPLSHHLPDLAVLQCVCVHKVTNSKHCSQTQILASLHFYYLYSQVLSCLILMMFRTFCNWTSDWHQFLCNHYRRECIFHQAQHFHPVII